MSNRAMTITWLVALLVPLVAHGAPPKGRPPMEEKRFWELIEQAQRGAPGHGMSADDRQAGALTTALAKLPAKEIVAFQDQLDRKMAESYRWDLWGAGYLLNGGCSDDCFEYFRGWLIGRGRKVYEEALKRPDSLAAFAAEPRQLGSEEAARECESFLYAARNAHLKVTNAELPPGDLPRARSPQGTPWNEDDLPRLLPRTAAKVIPAAR